VNSVIRQKNIKKRQNISKICHTKHSHKIISNLKKYLKKTKNIASYYAVKGEIETATLHSYLFKLKKNLYLPKIKDDKLEFFKYKPSSVMKNNKYKIPEPYRETSYLLKKIDIMFVPLVAFDTKCHRLGFGGGFYDKTLGQLQKKDRPILIGLAHSFQLNKNIKTHKFDIDLDFVFYG